MPVNLITSVADSQNLLHTVFSEENTISNMVTLKIKITPKGVQPVSEDSSRGDVTNNGQRYKFNSTASIVNMSTTTSLHATSRKRRADTSLTTHTVKKQKMEGNLKLQCASILKELMTTHVDAWIFNEPVDTEKWKIPDYFSIIKNPMDLGTVKRKLEGNVYSDIEEFASDVRLTFDNAMTYNPPGAEVHVLAKEFNDHFAQSWKSYEACMKRKNDKVHQDVADRTKTNGRDTKQSVETNCKAVGNKVVRFKDSLTPVHAMTIRPMQLNEERKLRLEVLPNRCSSMVRTVQKGHSIYQSAFADSGHRQSIKCSSCDSQPCSCMPKSDISSDRSTEHNRPGTSDGIDSDGCVSFDVQMSPNKALRAAMLKSRYADTIYKAKQLGHQDNCEKLDFAKVQKERERFERQQQEEKARIEAQIKAAQEASRTKAHNDMMLRRERERAAARISLQMVEKTVEIDENQSIIKELELLCYGSSYEGGIHHCVNHLERFGLYIKEDDEDDLDAILNAEEGEIL